MDDFEMASDAEIAEDLYPDFDEPADGHMAGLSASDRAKYGIGVGEGNYDVKNEGHLSGLSMTDRLRREGKPGPLDRVEQDGTTSRRREVSNEPDTVQLDQISRNDPVAKEFVQAMSGKLDADAMDEVVKWHTQSTQADLQELRSMDSEHSQRAINDLKQSWGEDYKGNLERIRTFLQAGPAGAYEAIANARLRDGVALMNDPATVEWLLSLTRQPTYRGGSGYQSENRIKELESYMRDHRAQYNKDADAQRELYQLYKQRESR